MNNKTAQILYIFARILSVIIFVFFIFASFSIIALCGFSGTPEIYDENIKEALTLISITFILLLAPFLLARKYPIVGGVIYMCFAVMITVFMLLNYVADFELLYYLIPASFLLDGALYLISGLIRRRNKESTPTGIGQRP